MTLATMTPASEETQIEDNGCVISTHHRYGNRDVIDSLHKEIGALKYMLGQRDETIQKRERELIAECKRVVWLEQQVRKLGDMLQLAEEEIENGYLN